MKKFLSILAVLALVFSPITPAFAIDKAAVGTDLTAGASWTGGVAPSTGVVANWVNTSLGAALTVATDVTWGSINVTDALTNIAISGAGKITLDTAGITLAAAGKDLTISNPIALGVAQAWNIGAARAMVASGNVTGAFALDKTGTGTLTLSGAANTYSGGTTLTAGTLNINSTTALGATAGAFTITTGTIDNTSGAAITLANNNAQTWNGDFTFTGTGGANGSLNMGTGAITLGASRVVTTTTAGSVLTEGGAITGAGFNITHIGTAATAALVLNGAIGTTTGSVTNTSGILTLAGVNTYSGGTTLTAGTLNINSTTALGATAGAFTITTGTIDNTSGAAITLANNNAQTWNGDFTFTGTGGANGSLNMGTGAITLGASRVVTTTTAGSVLTEGGAITGAGFNITHIGTAATAALVLNGAIGTTTGSVTNTSGILTLAGVNTYSGGTTLTAGTLNINSTTALGATAGAFTITTGTIDNTSGAAITLANNNAQTWNGDFTFTGTGGANGSLNMGTGAITLGASRVVTTTTAGSVLTEGGAITGAGFNITHIGTAATAALVLNGAIGTTTGSVTNTSGILTLAGVNTYSGGTTLTAGTLNINSTTALGATAGAFTITTGTIDNTSGAAITLANNNAQNWNGNFAFTGTNNLNLGTGAVTLGATPTITVNGGTLTEGGIIGGGANGITKAGTGTLILNGVNTYTGTTTVNAGTLDISGTGTVVGSVTLTGGGTGALTIGTNTVTLGAGKVYTQGAGTTLNVSITDASTFGKIVATGGNAAVTGGTVNVTVGSTYIAGGTTFKIIDGAAGGDVSGLTVTDNSYVLSFTGSTGVADYTLTAVHANSYNTLPTNNGNDSAAGSALERADQNGATGDMATVLNTLNQMGTAQEITNAIATMTPDVSSGASEASRAMTGNSFRMIGNRLGGARNGGAAGSGVSSGDMLNGTGVWIQGLGSNMKQDERKGIQGFSANTWGTTIGADKLIDSHFRAGLAGSYGWAGVHSKQPGNPSDDINSYQATIYGSYDSLDLCKARQNGKNSREAVRNQGDNFWYVDGMMAFTENDYDSRREIWLTPTTARVAKADHSGQQYSTNFEGGYTFTFEKTEGLEVTPFASIGYNYLRMNSYKEKGADALNLSVQGEGFHQLEQGLGTKLAYPIVAEKVGTFIPSAKAAWLYDYIGDRFETDASFAGGGGSFTTKGAKPAKNGMLFGAELAFLNKGNVTVTGNWDIELKNQFMSNTYYGTVRYDF